MEFSNDEIKAMLLRIEYEIARQKMSKKEFYEKSEISSSLYSQWNTGTAKPSMKSIGRAADALGVSVEFLAGIKKEKGPSAEDELMRRLQLLKDRPDLRDLLDVSAKNTPEQVERFTAWIESMQKG